MTLSAVLPSRLVILALGGVLLITLSACGGDDDDGDATATTSAPAATTAAPEGPGTITLTSSDIERQNGKILLVFAIPASGGERVARLCVPISAGSFTLPDTVMTEVPAGDDPCGGDTPAATLEEGTYTLTAGVYVGGQQTPDAEATISVEVAGDVTTELDGAELSD
jgi:hypothetical protein